MKKILLFLVLIVSLCNVVYAEISYEELDDLILDGNTKEAIKRIEEDDSYDTYLYAVYLPKIAILNHNDAYLYYVLSKKRHKVCRYHLALEAYEKCVKLDKKYKVYSTRNLLGKKNDKFLVAYSYMNKGLASYLSGKDKAALKSYNKILKEYPNFEYINSVYFYIALAEDKLGNKKLAEEFYNKAIDNNSELFYAVCQLNCGYHKEKR